MLDVEPGISVSDTIIYDQTGQKTFQHEHWAVSTTTLYSIWGLEQSLTPEHCTGYLIMEG